MKVLCDVHISYKLVNFFIDNGIEAVHINNILNKWNTKDKDICNHADLNNFVVITKDVDFRNSHIVKRTPKKLIRIILGNISNNELIEIFRKNLTDIKKKFKKEYCYIEIRKANISVI